MASVTDTAPAKTRCENCGAEIPADNEQCPVCGRAATTHSARMVLTFVLLLIFGGFGFTQYFVNLHRDTEEGLARRWFHRGEEAMQANKPIGAAEAYRTALSYDRENQEYRLRLAEALLAANRLNEARAHLTSLWEEEPADGEVNLALARLHARHGDVTEAVRFYGNAINGVWDEHPRQRRIATRFELVQYLTQHNQPAQAQAELLALQADAPSDPADQLRLAQMLMQLNEPQRAAQAYDVVLGRDRNNASAWLGKGEALLALADYNGAERAFARAADLDHKRDDIRQQLDLVREVLRADAALRGLSIAERARRVAANYQAAMKRLESCAAEQGFSLAVPNATAASQATPAPSAPESVSGQLQSLYASGQQKQASATEQALRKDPDALEPTMQYVFTAERATASICPATELTDRALLLLAGQENGTVK